MPPPVLEPEAPPRPPVQAETLRRVMRVTAIVLGLAAATQLLRYLLLMLNRTMLLHPLVAGAVNVLAILAGIAALAGLLGFAIVATRWLIERREAVFAARGELEPRSRRSIWWGCLLPGWNLIWAPVFVVELAHAEGNHRQLRRPITLWWVLWVCSAVVSTAVTVVSVLAVVRGFAADAQGVADTTEAAMFAYLLALAALLSLRPVLDTFECKPIDRPSHRWLMVPADRPASPAAPVAETEESAA